MTRDKTPKSGESKNVIKYGGVAEKPLTAGTKPATTPKPEHIQEALMTLATIMRDTNDPRLQVAAARSLLERAPPSSDDTNTQTLTEEELDATIAAAKNLLDQLAALKTGGVDGTRALAAPGTPEPDHTANAELADLAGDGGARLGQDADRG
jgi:hypothetical protein